jgi:hypothetical protein
MPKVRHLELRTTGSQLGRNFISPDLRRLLRLRQAALAEAELKIVPFSNSAGDT